MVRLQKCGVHLMEKSIARVIDKKLDFEKDGGIDTPAILFRLNSTIYTLSAFSFLVNGYYSIMSLFSNDILFFTKNLHKSCYNIYKYSSLILPAIIFAD